MSVSKIEKKAVIPTKIYLEDQRLHKKRDFMCVPDEEVFKELYDNKNF